MKLARRGLFFGIVGILAAWGLMGCTGVITRTAYLGNDFPLASSYWGPPPTDENRIIIYMINGGPSLNNSTGYVDFLTIDDVLYVIRGKTFSYLDLPIGRHVLTVSKVKEIPVLGPGIKPRRGKHLIELEITADETTYIKLKKSGIDILNHGANIIPTVMEESEALRDLEELAENIGFQTYLRIPSSRREAE